MNSSRKRKAMDVNGRRLIEDLFSWKAINAQFMKLYQKKLTTVLNFFEFILNMFSIFRTIFFNGHSLIKLINTSIVDISGLFDSGINRDQLVGYNLFSSWHGSRVSGKACLF